MPEDARGPGGNHNLPPVSIAVIGGGSGMGKWIARFLQRQSYVPTLVDIDTGVVKVGKQLGLNAICVSDGTISPLLSTDGILPYDVVILAVPMSAIAATARLYGQSMKSGSLLMDVASSKVPAMSAMQESVGSDVHILGTHPAFGPAFPNFAGQTCVIVTSETRPPGHWMEWWEKLVEAEHGATVTTSARQHDHMMSIVQVLVHVAVISFGVALVNAKTDFNEIHAYKTPPFELLSSLVGRVFSHTADLYRGIQHNQGGKEMRDLFLKAVQSTSAAIQNPQTFEALFTRVSNAIGDTNRSAMQFNAKTLFKYLGEARTKLYERRGCRACLENVETDVIHYGVLEDVSPMWVKLRKSNGRITRMATKKVRLFSPEEQVQWLSEHGPLDRLYVRLLCPRSACPETIASTLRRHTPIVETAIRDVYEGRSVPQGLKKVSMMLHAIPPPDGPDVKPAVRSWIQKLGYSLVDITVCNQQYRGPHDTR